MYPCWVVRVDSVADMNDRVVYVRVIWVFERCVIELVRNDEKIKASITDKEV